MPCDAARRLRLPRSEDLIRFENVGMRYGNGPEVLRDVSFTLEPGTFHFLTGASGAGKSSLRGLITMFGHDVASLKRAELPPLRRRIGVVFQNFRLLDHLSALDNVALPLRVAGAKESDVREHVAELLSWVGLGDHLNDRPATLSGGQQQRVAIARAVITRPSLLLADEPTGNVDDRIGMRLLHLFEELNKLGTTIVIATHNEMMIERFGYARMVLDKGMLQHLPRGSAATRIA
jgi:cell division transport system ATP-binding protein